MFLTWTGISEFLGLLNISVHTYYHLIFLDKSRTSQIGRPICTVIPTYLVPFCPILLEIPTYPNIGRPLWTFPKDFLRSTQNLKNLPRGWDIY